MFTSVRSRRKSTTSLIGVSTNSSVTGTASLSRILACAGVFSVGATTTRPGAWAWATTAPQQINTMAGNELNAVHVRNMVTSRE
jgi:hypothetical protein